MQLLPKDWATFDERAKSGRTVAAMPVKLQTRRLFVSYTLILKDFNVVKWTLREHSSWQVSRQPEIRGLMVQLL